MNQLLHGRLAERRFGQGDGGGEEEQALDDGVGDGGPLQCAAAAEHVSEVHQRPVAQTQGQVQVAQADIHVDAEHPVAQRGQTGGYTAGNGGLSRAALSRRDHNCSGHRFTPVV